MEEKMRTREIESALKKAGFTKQDSEFCNYWNSPTATDGSFTRVEIYKGIERDMHPCDGSSKPMMLLTVKTWDGGHQAWLGDGSCEYPDVYLEELE